MVGQVSDSLMVLTSIFHNGLMLGVMSLFGPSEVQLMIFFSFDFQCLNIGIKHGFSCINIRQVPWEVLKNEAEGRGFQHLQRDLANVNALKNYVRSLLLHKNLKHLLHLAVFLGLFGFAFSPMSRERNFHGLCPI